VTTAEQELESTVFRDDIFIPSKISLVYPQLSLLQGWVWHNEVAIIVLRLFLAGVLDRHPKLKIVVGHQGEMMPMMIQRVGSNVCH